MRKLASIQKILDLNPISNADKIEVATVLGWKVVVKKNQFKIGELVVYCEVDTLLPEWPEFEFLRNKKFRIKSVKLKGQLSQGIIFSIKEVLPSGDYEIGQDVSDIIGVKKYDPPMPAQLSGIAKGSFPGHTPKTDEIRIQSSPNLIKEFEGKLCYVSVKIDGSSATFSNYDGDVDVCTRNWSLKESETNTLWKLYHRYKIKDIFNKVGNFSIQGEVAGEGIQKNPLKLKGQDFFVFNVYDVNAGRYLDFEKMLAFCDLYDLKTVPIIDSNIVFNYTLEELLEMATGKYEGTKNRREGIVIRPMIETYSPILCGRLSVKVINNDFLLKEGL